MVESRAGIVPSMLYAEAVKGTVFPEWNKTISKKPVTLNVSLGQLEGWIFMSAELTKNFALGEKELEMDKVTGRILNRKVRKTSFREHVELLTVLLNEGAPRFYPDLTSVDDLAETIREGFASGMFGNSADMTEVIAVNMSLGDVRSLVTAMAYQSATILSMWENADITRADLVGSAEFACRSLADVLSQLKEQGVKVDNRMLGDALLVVNVLDAI